MPAPDASPETAVRLLATTLLGRTVLAAVAAVTARPRAEGSADLAFGHPLQIAVPDGAQINGIVDCLASGPDGPPVLGPGVD